METFVAIQNHRAPNPTHPNYQYETFNGLYRLIETSTSRQRCRLSLVYSKTSYAWVIPNPLFRPVLPTWRERGGEFEPQLNTASPLYRIRDIGFCYFVNPRVAITTSIIEYNPLAGDQNIRVFFSDFSFNRKSLFA